MDGLADDLLISIVSLLPVKEAVMTSVLARRWRRFWTHNRVLKFGSPDDFKCTLDFHSDEWYKQMLYKYRREKVMEWRSVPRMKKLALQFNVEVVAEVDICHATVRAISKAPLLDEIVLMLIGLPPYESRRPLYLRQEGEPYFPILDIMGHKCLKVLEIRGGGGTPLAVELALYVTECTASLEKVVIDGVPYTGEALHLLKKDLLAQVAAAAAAGVALDFSS